MCEVLVSSAVTASGSRVTVTQLHSSTPNVACVLCSLHWVAPHQPAQVCGEQRLLAAWSAGAVNAPLLIAWMQQEALLVTCSAGHRADLVRIWDLSREQVGI